MNSAKLPLHLALCVALLSLSARAQNPAATPNPALTERFLVIVETSAAMQKRAENVQKAMGSVISSGLQRNISPGSTIGLWTFNDKLATGQLPLQLWNPSTRQTVALTIVQFLQQQKYEKTSRLPVVWEAASNIVAQSERITILLVTTGSDPMAGTPFDAEITESYLKNSDQQRKQNMPFLTILRAVKGKFVAFAVNMPPWPLEVPAYPDGFHPTPPPAPVVTETKPAPPVVKRPDPAILSATNTIYLAETTPPTEPTPTAQPEPNNPVVATVAAPARATPSKTAEEPDSKPKIETPTSTAKAVEPEATGNPNAKFPVVTILVAGIALLLGVMVVFIALLRWSRRATGESLITHSMNKDR